MWDDFQSLILMLLHTIVISKYIRYDYTLDIPQRLSHSVFTRLLQQVMVSSTKETERLYYNLQYTSYNNELCQVLGHCYNIIRVD